MSSLLVWKEKMQRLYANYSLYILKALQLLMGLLLFGMINYNIGFMKTASSVFCTIGLAVICMFLPMIVMTLAAAALVLVHFYALSMPIAVISVLIFLLMYIFYFRFYSGKIMAAAGSGSCIRPQNSFCCAGCIRTSGYSGLDCSGRLRRNCLLHDPFCKSICHCIEEFRLR